ncbi:unnamed protein product, partial [Rotaria sp. Silwood2]
RGEYIQSFPSLISITRNSFTSASPLLSPQLDIMTTFKRHTNTSLLPDDIFSYTDTQFYDIVKRIVGESAAELLEIQSIRSPDSLLQIPDVFAILNIKCAALNSLKEKICLKSDDDLYIVKPGIKSLMNYFCELIIKKQDE